MRYKTDSPGDILESPLKEWTFHCAITRMPEFSAPKLRTRSNTVSVDAEVPASANGVLYSLGGFSGGLTTYMQDGTLCFLEC